MRIDDYKLSGNGTASAAPAVDTTGLPSYGLKQEQSGAVAGSGDSVALSGLSRILQSSEGVRAKRIEMLSAELRAGSYRADPRMAARALIAETLAGSDSTLNA